MIPRTLRARLILSHILPLLIVVPLMGWALIYVLEMQVVLPNLIDELTGETALLAESAREHPAIWSKPAEARAFAVRFGRDFDDQLMLIGVDGRILASSDPNDAAQLGMPFAHPGLRTALSGRMDIRAVHQLRPEAEIVDVLAPVAGPRGGTAGIIRVTLHAGSVIEEFFRRRYLIAGILVAGALAGSIIGSILAINLAQPLHQVTESVQQLAEGQRWTALPEARVEEIGRLVRAFNTLVERLRALEDARRQLLANLVHELGRPLGALGAAVQALRRGADEDAALRGELLTGIDNELDRLGRLLDDLARLRDRVLGPLELDRRSIAVGEWLPQGLTAWREAALRKDLEWHVALSNVLPVAYIDPDRMAQALGNLISNAIKFTPSGGAVSVGAGVDHDVLWIRVSDTGPGIPSADHERIFEPFYRGGGEGPLAQGMGLGLTIARDLVAAHGGRLDLENGTETRFTIRLPLHTDQSYERRGPVS